MCIFRVSGKIFSKRQVHCSHLPFLRKLLLSCLVCFGIYCRINILKVTPFLFWPVVLGELWLSALVVLSWGDCLPVSTCESIIDRIDC